MNHPYTVIDTATDDILRSGYCTNPADVARQAKPGREVLAGRFDGTTHVIRRDRSGKPEAIPRPAADVAAYHAAQATHLEKAEGLKEEPSALLREVLKAKGLEVTPGDIAAARAKLKAKGQAGL